MSDRQFAGAADDYARYRLPYPDALIADLVAAASGGVLLDLACGTGELAIPLSPYFQRVLAVDAEPDMIDAGRRKAADAPITWTVGAAEELRLAPGSLGMITIGNAFHRLARGSIATAAFTWLRPGAPIAIVDTASVWRGSEPWQRRAVEVIARWAPRPAAAAGPHHEDFLRYAGFTAVEEFRYPTPHRWTVDAFLGYVYSTSVASRRALGPRVAAFEAEMRQALGEFESGLTELADFRCLSGRRPGLVGGSR